MKLRKRFCLTEIPIVKIRNVIIDIILDIGNTNRKFNIWGVLDGHDFTDLELSHIGQDQIRVPYDNRQYLFKDYEEGLEFFIITFSAYPIGDPCEKVGVVAIKREEFIKRRKEILDLIRD